VGGMVGGEVCGGGCACPFP